MVDLAQLQNYMKNPAMLDESTIPELELLIREFPYFQIAHILLAINSKAANHIRYSGRLKMAAAHAGDRGLLRRHIENIANKSADVAENLESPSETIIVPLVRDVIPEVSESATDESAAIREEVAPQADEQADIEPVSCTDDSEKQLESEVDVPEQQPQSLLLHLRELADQPDDEVADTSGVFAGADERPKKVVEVISVQETSAVESFTERKSEKDASIDDSAAFPDELLLESLQYSQYRVEDVLKAGDTDDGTAQNAPFEEVNEGLQDKTKDIIDRFIEAGPRISKPKKEFFNPADKARESSIDNEGIVTETLAKIYLMQGNPEKAINIYRKLSLNNPNKSTYFAAQIARIQDDLLNA